MSESEREREREGGWGGGGLETSSDAINERKAISRLLGVRQKDIQAERERDRKSVRERDRESDSDKESQRGGVGIDRLQPGQ